jgi:hypothetical protein
VNLEALAELDELEERHRFQLAQRQDLQDSESKMRGIIGEINAKPSWSSRRGWTSWKPASISWPSPRARRSPRSA